MKSVIVMGLTGLLLKGVYRSLMFIGMVVILVVSLLLIGVTGFGLSIALATFAGLIQLLGETNLGLAAAGLILTGIGVVYLLVNIALRKRRLHLNWTSA